jgi:hypothetical protein
VRICALVPSVEKIIPDFYTLLAGQLQLPGKI